MAWNLLDTLNSDLTKTNLFDGIDTAESNKKLTNQAAPIEKAQEIAPDPVQLNQDVGQAQVFNQRDSAGQRAKPDSKIGVFDSIPTEKETQFTEAAPIQKNITLGEVFDRGVGHIRDIEASFKANNYGKDGEKGENAAIHTAWKAAYFEKLSSTVEDKFGIPRDQVGSIFTTLAKTNGGFRTAREMDEIIKIQKEGVSFTGVDGEVTVGPDEPWEVALAAHKAKQTAALRGEKPVEDKTVDELAKLNTTRAALDAMPDGPGKRAQLELLDKKENDLTRGKANYNRHVAMENNISTALASANDRNLNYRGLRFDSPEAKEDPKGQLSGNDFLIEAAGNGSLPTITIGKDGFNTSAADDYLKKHGVDSTPVGIWESGKLNAYRFTPSAEKGKQFVPIMVKGPEVAKKSVDGNPFAALSDELNAKDEVNRANNSREENEKKYVQLVQDRKELLKPEPKQEDRIQFGGGGVTRLRGSRTPQEEAQEKRNSWDKQSARIQAVEKQLGTFDPEGSGYDIKTAVAAGMEPDSKTKHWGSVRKSTPDEIKKYGVPEDSYLLLKGAKHPTHNLAVQYEAQRGFEIKKIGDRYFSIPVKK